MGFYLRKGFNFGPLRLNLSRSGLGASFGVKGARIGVGPRGSYIHMGRGGLYYRQTLSLGGAQYFTFEAPSGAFNVNLKGHFAATGGAGSDIEVYLLTADDLVNWQNGHTVHTLYNSGRVTQETVNVALPNDGAKYCLVFSNKFSFLTAKAVQADIALTYHAR